MAMFASHSAPKRVETCSAVPASSRCSLLTEYKGGVAGGHLHLPPRLPDQEAPTVPATCFLRSCACRDGHCQLHHACRFNGDHPRIIFLRFCMSPCGAILFLHPISALSGSLDGLSVFRVNTIFTIGYLTEHRSGLGHSSGDSYTGGACLIYMTSVAGSISISLYWL